MSSSVPPIAPLLNWLASRWPPADRQARRLFHGRGQAFAGLESLNLDWYPPLLLITAYGPVAETDLQTILEFLDRESAGGIGCVMLQRRDRHPATWRLLRGALPPQPLAREGELMYPLRLGQGVNHGFFPDMAAGRDWLRRHGRGKKILNLFAYTCSLSVAALAGGATEVVNLDMSRSALAVGRDAHRLNGIDPRRAAFLAHDLFKSFGRLRRLGPFDLAVIDPPAAQGRSFQPAKDWPRILRRLPELLRPGAEILACVSAPELGREFLERQFAEHLPAAVACGHLVAGADFPERDPDKGWHLLHYRYP